MSISDWFFFVLTVLIGLASGSFANVCILRIPADLSIVFPASHCFSCGRALLWRDNIPLLSFVLLRAKCRWCAAPISPRYPLIEFLTCAVFTGIYLRFGASLPTLVYCILALDLIIASGIDWDHLWIPRFLTTPGTVIGLVLVTLVWFFEWPGEWIVRTPWDALLGACVGGGVIYLVRLGANWYYNRYRNYSIYKENEEDPIETMGLGDVDLMLLIGMFIGWDLALLTIFLGSLFGSLFGLVTRFCGYKLIKIPFGPYLALGAYLCLLWGHDLIHWYFSGLFF